MELEPRGGARSVAALVAAAAVVVVVVGVVVAFGIAPYPDVPRLADQPDPPVTSQLAYLVYDEREPCLHVVDGRGVDREVRCGTDVEAGAPTWLDDGHVELHRYRFGDEVVTIDVATGELTDTRPATEGEKAPPVFGSDERDDGARVATTGTGSTARVEVRTAAGETTTVLELDGPDGYRLEDPRWTGDGDWIVVRDTGGRVLVLGADGTPSPRVWVTDVWEYAAR